MMLIVIIVAHRTPSYVLQIVVVLQDVHVLVKVATYAFRSGTSRHKPDPDKVKL